MRLMLRTITSFRRGFTLIEMMVVIVIIAILAGIIVTVYSGVQDEAHAASVQADVRTNAQLLDADFSTNEEYPADLDAANGGKGLISSKGNEIYYYTNVNRDLFCLESGYDNGRAYISYYMQEDSSVPIPGYCDGINGVYQENETIANVCNQSNPPSYCIKDKSKNFGSGNQVSLGEDFACKVDSGEVYCWGVNWDGQLGNGTYNSSNSPTKVNGLLSGKTVTKVSVGFYHACALANAQVYCWGHDDGDGELGDGSWGSSTTPVYVSTFSGKTVTSVAAGGYNTCAVADGKAYCWGYGYSGRNGNGSTSNSAVPVQVDTNGVMNGKVIVEISTGDGFSCALSNDSNVYCWGYGGEGSLGDGLQSTSYVPVLVEKSTGLSGRTLVDVAARGTFACALSNNGHMYCWGSNSYGELGLDSGEDNMFPTPEHVGGDLSGGNISSSLAQGTSSTNCAAYNNQPYCWGYNDNLQVGVDNTSYRIPTPSVVSSSKLASGSNSYSFSGFYNETCAIADGTVYCWGDATYTGGEG